MHPDDPATASDARATPALVDEWAPHRTALLTGFVERHGFAPWFAALFVLFVAFIGFQFVIAPIALVAALAASQVDLLALLDEIATGGTAALSGYNTQLLVANTFGLVLAFGVPALLLARLSTRQVGTFLRLRRCDVAMLGLSVVGWVALVPIVQFVAQLNAALPWPEEIRQFEEQMLAPLMGFLERPDVLVPALLMIAVAPAICEELLFRGYIQRQFERSAGVTWSIALAGVLFGLYHLQPTKLVPLAALGCYFAFLTWRSGSLIPAMVTHFLQNGSVIVLGNVYARSPSREIADIDSIVTPWYVAAIAVVILAGVLYLLNRRARALLSARKRGTPPQPPVA